MKVKHYEVAYKYEKKSYNLPRKTGHKAPYNKTINRANEDSFEMQKRTFSGPALSVAGTGISDSEIKPSLPNVDGVTSVIPGSSDSLVDIEKEFF